MRILNQSGDSWTSLIFISLKIKLKIGIVFGKCDLVVEKMDNINYIFCYFWLIFFKSLFMDSATWGREARRAGPQSQDR